MTLPADPWFGRGGVIDSRVARVSRRARLMVLVAEAVVAVALGALALRNPLGWSLLGVAVAAAVLVVVAVRTGWSVGAGERAPEPESLLPALRVVEAQSRSNGEVGVVSDGQGFAAGIELDIARGTAIDVATLCLLAAGDASRPSALQLRLVTSAPPVDPRALQWSRRGVPAVFRRMQVVLRFEPAWAGDAVTAHGGGARGSRSALVAALDRLSARLRRSGVHNQVLGVAALNALIADDTGVAVPSRIYSVSASESEDLVRLAGVLQHAAPERSVLSLCVDFRAGDQWESFGAVQVATRSAEQSDAVGAALLADPAVLGVAPRAALSAVLPVGGGPGDLTSVLTLLKV